MCQRCGGLLVTDESVGDAGVLIQQRCLLCAWRSHGKVNGVDETTRASGRYDAVKRKQTAEYKRRET
jgi:hypothetical protein